MDYTKLEHIITQSQMVAFEEYLRIEERTEHTISKYLHDVQAFCKWLDGSTVTKERVTQWKEYLFGVGRAAVTVNAALAALHSFFTFTGWQECRVKYLKIQRKVFRDASKDLTRDDFYKLVACANGKGDQRLALLMETICATGMRVSEVRYITVEAAQRGRADIWLKGKIRTILIPDKLARKLMKYAKKQKIACGEIFRTASGKCLCRKQIWSDMKKLCKQANVDAKKVFPHNLRHLFARTFYKACRDIVRLADVLGHSSIDTTRIYLVTTGAEYAEQLDQLGLVL